MSLDRQKDPVLVIRHRRILAYDLCQIARGDLYWILTNLECLLYQLILMQFTGIQGKLH